MKKLLFLGALALLPTLAQAQYSNFPAVIGFPGAPSGSCAATQLGVNTSSGALSSCNAGTWTAVGQSLPDLTDSAGVSLTSTVPFRGIDGSATVPTYSFTNATATGMAQSGTSLYLVTPAQSINFNNGATVAGTFNTNTGLFTQYGAAALAGYGFPAIRGVTSQRNETTTADANVLTYTPPAVVGTYKVSVNISVSSATAGVIAWTLSWTDSNGAAQANIAMPLFQHGTAAPNTTFTTSVAGNYTGTSTIDVNNAAAAIVVKWVGGGVTAAKVSAVIERVQ